MSRIFLVFIFLVGLSGCYSSSILFGKGGVVDSVDTSLRKPDVNKRETVIGAVKDVDTNRPQIDAQVTVYSGKKKVAVQKTDKEGNYELPLTPGEYTLEISSNSYKKETVYIEVKSGESTTVETVRQVPALTVSEKAEASGQIIDAITGKPVAGAVLSIREGVNSHKGKTVASIRTDNEGQYQLANLASGNYTAEVSKEGFISNYYSVLLSSQVKGKQQNIPLSPKIAKGKLRVVLSWGEKPGDLDSHLITPFIENRRYRIYFANNGNESPAAKSLLDVDRTDLNSKETRTIRKGPETITVYQSYPGIYRYKVHNFSKTHASSLKGAFSDSRAKVEVYNDQGLVRSFNVPVKGQGDYWEVFTYNGSTGKITAINQLVN